MVLKTEMVADYLKRFNNNGAPGILVGYFLNFPKSK